MTSLVSRVSKLVTNPLLASRPIVLFLVATGTLFGLPVGNTITVPDVNLPLLYGLARWDSGYYLGIATGGDGFFQHPYFFLPLLPPVLPTLYPPFFSLDV